MSCRCKLATPFLRMHRKLQAWPTTTTTTPKLHMDMFTFPWRLNHTHLSPITLLFTRTLRRTRSADLVSVVTKPFYCVVILVPILFSPWLWLSALLALVSLPDCLTSACPHCWYCLALWMIFSSIKALNYNCFHLNCHDMAQGMNTWCAGRVFLKPWHYFINFTVQNSQLKASIKTAWFLHTQYDFTASI